MLQLTFLVCLGITVSEVTTLWRYTNLFIIIIIVLLSTLLASKVLKSPDFLSWHYPAYIIELSACRCVLSAVRLRRYRLHPVASNKSPVPALLLSGSHRCCRSSVPDSDWPHVYRWVRNQLHSLFCYGCLGFQQVLESHEKGFFKIMPE